MRLGYALPRISRATAPRQKLIYAPLWNPLASALRPVWSCHVRARILMRPLRVRRVGNLCLRTRVR